MKKPEANSPQPAVGATNTEVKGLIHSGAAEAPCRTSMERSELRQTILTARQQLSQDEAALKSQQIIEHLTHLAHWKQAKTVLLYVAFRNEVETRDLIDRAIRQGKQVLLPVSIKKTRELILYQVQGSQDLVEGAYGIMEPRSDSEPVAPGLVDLVVVPGVVFDGSGNRLGYGAGYYDRFLQRCRSDAARIALAFDLQVIEELPSEPHDQRMDYIITESQIYHCPPRE